jgi:Ca2+-binding EF-hand superfamily protein
MNDTGVASNASEESLSIGEYSPDHSLNGGDEEEPVENELALLAFGYFDVSGRGYLNVDDTRKILTRLGRGLHKQTLDDMLDKLAVKSDGVARLYYHDLLE